MNRSCKYADQYGKRGRLEEHRGPFPRSDVVVTCSLGRLSVDICRASHDGRWVKEQIWVIVTVEGGPRLGSSGVGGLNGRRRGLSCVSLMEDGSG